MCDSCYVSEHRISAVPGFSSRFGGCPGWHNSSFSSDLPRIFLKELQSVEEGLYSSFPHHHSELSVCPTPSFRTILPSHIIIQNYSSDPRRHSELLFSPTSLLRTTIIPSHVIIQNYSSVPRRHSELFFRPTSSFRIILPPHVIIQNYSSAPRLHSELFLRSTSSFGIILAPHVFIRNYSCVPRHHSELFSRLTSIRIILAYHVIIRELFFRPTSPFGNYSSVRR